MKKTALNEVHRRLGARMIEFGGWDMPVHYESIVSEHRAVRSGVGLFDLQHMGRLRFTGPDRAAALDRLLSNDVAGTPLGRARYALVTADDGGVIDDCIYYALPEAIVLIVNASNREAVLEWFAPRLTGDVTLEDATERWAMIAVQGPKAQATLAPLCDFPIEKLKYYRCQGGMVLGEPCLVARTGYTGEVGYELVFDARDAERMWTALLHHGQAHGIRPIGLGARDSLRLEAGMPLYGHELDRATNPLEADLDFGVALDGAEFPGREALRRVRAEGPRRKLVGFRVEGPRIPRQGAAVLKDGAPQGAITSGTKSPMLDVAICLAYVPRALAAETSGWEVEISGKRYPLTPTPLPFFSKTRKAS